MLFIKIYISYNLAGFSCNNKHSKDLMKEKLVAVLAATLAGTAYAQTNVTINGELDVGVLKETGSDTRMMRNHDNLLRFKGTEELGNGTQAVFNLEHRWDSSTGERCAGNNFIDRFQGHAGVDWQGAANVGIQNKDWGRILLGRVSNIHGETYYRIDPFIYDGISSSFGTWTLVNASQNPNSFRYDTPEWNGFRVLASYSVGRDTHINKIKEELVKNEINPHTYGNDGYNVAVTYDNGPFFALANIEKVQDSDNSWGWSVGAGYTIADNTFTLGYHNMNIGRGVGEAILDDSNALKQKSVTAGWVYKTGPHVFKASYNWGRVESDGKYNGHSNKYGLGYDYYLSKRTWLYTNLAYIDNSKKEMGAIYNSNGAQIDSMTGVNVGITHRF